MSEYQERDEIALDEAGGYYTKHVVAMTKEGLHDKADIAAELAMRDYLLDKANKQIDKLNLSICMGNNPKETNDKYNHLAM